MPESRLVLFLLALFCPSYALHAGEQQVTDFEEQHRNATSPDFSIAATGGTQGLGLSIGYRFNPYIGVRLRGATLGYSSTETWGNQRTRLNLNGDNAGLLVDIHPFGGNFYLTAGLTHCESTMRYRARFTRGLGKDCHIQMGGFHFELREDSAGELSGKYSWNKLQSYLGIGYTETITVGYPLYYSIDLGINYMGNGKFRSSNKGYFTVQDPRWLTTSEATDEQINAAVRRESRDFFRLADRLRFYPVLQLSVGLQF